MTSPNGSGHRSGRALLGPGEKRLPWPRRRPPRQIRPAAPSCEQGGNHLLEITLILGVHLGGDFELFARAYSPLRSPCPGLFPAKSDREMPVVVRPFVKREKIRWQAVVNGRRPSGRRQRPPLGVGDRQQGHFVEFAQERLRSGGSPSRAGSSRWGMGTPKIGKWRKSQWK